jgi:DNA-binding CsgD family transcriptional regulator
MRRLARLLDEADRFVDAAALVCDETRRSCELDECAVMLHHESGRPAVIVDNIADLADDHRLACVSALDWGTRPALRALRRRAATLGVEQTNTDALMSLTRPDRHTFALPIIDTRDPLGTLGCGQREPFAPAAQRDLAVIAMHLSVWCARRGVSAVRDDPYRLGPRQREVAALAARGLTNLEIRDALEISINTVKVRLKEVFVRLDVTNRTELAIVLRDAGPDDDTPIGVTRLGPITTTRSA